MFWFLAAVALFVLLMDQRTKSKAAFRRGQLDIKRRIEALIESGKLSPENLRAALDDNQTLEVDTETRESDASIASSQSSEENFDDVISLGDDRPMTVVEPTVYDPEQAERNALQNLNIMLYVGSFLIVAAVALFVNLTMPVAVRLTSIILASAAFYTAGLLVHAKSERLRPAAVAFTGTGLAILPFVGLALHSASVMTAEASWLIVSAVGILAYGVAASRLKSQLVSYLTMAYVLSFGLSAVSTFGLGLMWYYLVIIVISTACSCLHLLWPDLAPKAFSKPIEQTGQIMTPAVLVASLPAAGHMDAFMYEVIFAAASLHYIALWLISRLWQYEAISRVLVHVTGLVMAYDLSERLDSVPVFAVAWFVLALLQAVFSLLRVDVDDRRSYLWEGYAVMASVVLLLINLFMWSGAPHQYVWVSLVISGIGLVSVAAASRLRRIEWLYAAVAASTALILVLARWVAAPAINFEVVAVAFALLAVVALISLERAKSRGKPADLQYLLASATAMYTVALALCGLASGSSIHGFWSTLVAAVLTVMLSYLVAYGVAVEVAGATLLIVSVFCGTAWLVDSSSWQSLISVVVSSIAVLIGAALHYRFRQSDRLDALFAIGAIIFAGLVFTSGFDEVVIRSVVALLSLGGIGMLVLRVLSGNSQSQVVRATSLAGYLVYPLLSIAVATQAPELGWLVLALGAFAGVLWASSYLEKRPVIMLAGHLLLLPGLASLWSWLEFDSDWAFYGVIWLAAAVYYIWYWLAYSSSDALRKNISLGATAVVLAVSILGGMFAYDYRFVMASVISVMALSTVMAVHGYLQKNDNYIEAAVYLATAGFQRLILLAAPSANLVMYGHWWAFTIALVALWRPKEQMWLRLKIALGLITTTTGLYALSTGGIYSLVFLVEHLVVAVVGALLGLRWVMWWGVVATVLAVVYFLRDYTSILLLLLGLLMVAFVVWRLLKLGDKVDQEA